MRDSVLDTPVKGEVSLDEHLPLFSTPLSSSLRRSPVSMSKHLFSSPLSSTMSDFNSMSTFTPYGAEKSGVNSLLSSEEATSIMSALELGEQARTFEFTFGQAELEDEGTSEEIGSEEDSDDGEFLMFDFLEEKKKSSSSSRPKSNGSSTSSSQHLSIKFDPFGFRGSSYSHSLRKLNRAMEKDSKLLTREKLRKDSVDFPKKRTVTNLINSVKTSSSLAKLSSKGGEAVMSMACQKRIAVEDYCKAPPISSSTSSSLSDSSNGPKRSKRRKNAAKGCEWI